MAAMNGERDWRTPALVLGAGALLLAVSLGTRHTFGLFLAPMSQSNGWTREVFGFAIALQNLVWGVAQPFAGRVADRYGTGRVIVGGTVLYVAGLVLMAYSRTGTMLALSAGLLIGIGLSGVSFPVVFGAILRRTPVERRSLAMGVAMSVGSLGQFVMLPGALDAIQRRGQGDHPALARGARDDHVAAGGAARRVPAAAPRASAHAPARGARRGARPTAASGCSASASSSAASTWSSSPPTCPPSSPTGASDATTGAVVLALVGLFNIAGSYVAGLLAAGAGASPGCWSASTARAPW